MIKDLIYLSLGCFLSSAVIAQDLPERIEAFKHQLDSSNSLDSYDIKTIQSKFPSQLLKHESMLPQTSNYLLKDLQRLYKFAQTCKGKPPSSPLLNEPGYFTKAICKGNRLTPKWFSRSGLIHPGGGTYASRYAVTKPRMRKLIQDYMHIKERPKADATTLLGKLQKMDYNTMQAFISGSEMFIHGQELWVRQSDFYFIFNKTLWEGLLKENKLTITIYSKENPCFVKTGNICWEIKSYADLLFYVMIGLVLFNIILILIWAITRWNSRRNEMKRRMLVLQILTHELRTPIASLSLTVEGFRREFENLPKTVYNEFRKLCEDTRRLRLLATASKDYLQSDNQPLASEWLPSVNDWLNVRFQDVKHPIKIEINKDSAIKINIYWLGTCLDNLIENAIKYGTSPVLLHVQIKKNFVVFKVIDQGKLSKKNWNVLRKPFTSEGGLGLGLTIVESMIERMGGKMFLKGPPTTFILEIPCETDFTFS